MMVIAEYGRDDLAKVYVARMRDENGQYDARRHTIEFVESLQPPHPRQEKWVVIVSSLFGCPVSCMFCDAGGAYAGRLTADEMLEQVEYLARKRFPDGKVATGKFKVQFARMGEPSLNPAVLDAMERLPRIYDSGILHVSLSTVAPSLAGARRFFERLIEVKNRHYTGGRFQLQFSVHTTGTEERDRLMPVKKWSLDEIAQYGRRFASPENGDRKVTLNFAPVSGYPIDTKMLRKTFDPEIFLIKLTPLNPTVSARESALKSSIDPGDSRTSDEIVRSFEKDGYEVILSIGELEENRIGSNCGQFVQKALGARVMPKDSYELGHYKADDRRII